MKRTGAKGYLRARVTAMVVGSAFFALLGGVSVGWSGVAAGAMFGAVVGAIDP